MKHKAQNLLSAGIKTIYLSYPMTNDVDGTIAKRMMDLVVELEKAGLFVINPAQLALQIKRVRKEPNYRDYMGFDLMVLSHQADAILLADEWKQSRGCRCEAFTAHTCDIMMLDERLTQLAPSVVMYECFQPAK